MVRCTPKTPQRYTFAPDLAPSPIRSMPGTAVAILLLAFLGGCFYRVLTLGASPLWVDEAESSINALTILRDGLPYNTYLGIPIFENTLVQRWDSHSEYAFKDISYSDRGLAIYHGWLPLYSIAASFRAFGIKPDFPNLRMVPRYNYEARWLRTVAARVPALLFGCLIMIVLFFAAADIFRDWRIGLSAVVLSSLWSLHITISQQARYYAPTALFSLITGWLVWRVATIGGLRNFIFAGIAFAALFHTHLLSFLVTGLLFILCLPFILRKRLAVRNILIFGCIVGSTSVPWLLMTGLWGHADRIPKAWELFSWRYDLFPFSIVFSEIGVILAVGLVALICGVLLPGIKWIEVFHRQLLVRLKALVFLYVWAILGYLTFSFAMPAVSMFRMRLALMMLAPVTLLMSCILSAMGEAFWPARKTGAALGLIILAATASYWLRPVPFATDTAAAFLNITRAMDFLSSRPVADNTRIYATPNDHLTLMFYSGLPVQSIAPVRREFLNSYGGDVILFEKTQLASLPNDPLNASNLIQEAQQRGLLLSTTQAEDLIWAARTSHQRATLTSTVRSVEPKLQELPSFLQPLATAHHRYAAEQQSKISSTLSSLIMFRGFRIQTLFDWWTVYFYRFSDPTSHLLHPVYDQRLQNATAYFLKANWIVYHSPGKSEYLR